LILYSFIGGANAYRRAADQLPRFGWAWFAIGYALFLGSLIVILIQHYREPKARFF